MLLQSTHDFMKLFTINSVCIEAFGKLRIETLRSNDATATGTSVKKWICVLSVFIVIISTLLLCRMQASPPEAEYQGTISKLSERCKISSLLVYVLHKTRNQTFSGSREKTGKKCTKKFLCTCKVVVLLIKPIFFFTFSLPSASLGVPNGLERGFVKHWLNSVYNCLFNFNHRYLIPYSVSVFGFHILVLQFLRHLFITVDITKLKK